jgi:uncharacterized protein (DUF3820 family)
MPFGKWKGYKLRDVPPDYLEWAMRWIGEDDDRAERFADLLEHIEKYLEQ